MFYESSQLASTCGDFLIAEAHLCQVLSYSAAPQQEISSPCSEVRPDHISQDKEEELSSRPATPGDVLLGSISASSETRLAVIFLLSWGARSLGSSQDTAALRAVSSLLYS